MLEGLHDSKRVEGCNNDWTLSRLPGMMASDALRSSGIMLVDFLATF